jgi:hypothetical protein
MSKWRMFSRAPNFEYNLRFENRECYSGAVVVGDEVLLGAMPIEDMNRIVVPPLRRVMVNPFLPNFAEGPVKGFSVE